MARHNPPDRPLAWSCNYQALHLAAVGAACRGAALLAGVSFELASSALMLEGFEKPEAEQSEMLRHQIAQQLGYLNRLPDWWPDAF